jgi:hypothetical protein
MRKIAMFCITLLATPAEAGPVELTGPQIEEALNDTILVAGPSSDIEQIFQKSGQTIYIDRGNSSQGTWFVENDHYCSLWPPGTSKSCFIVTRDGETITFISASGKIYAMRPKQAARSKQ